MQYLFEVAFVAEKFEKILFRQFAVPDWVKNAADEIYWLVSIRMEL